MRLIDGQTWRRSIAGRLVPVLLCLALTPAAAPVHAQPPAESTTATLLEVQVVAASLFRFLGYVDWPADALPPDSPYVIGVIAADAIAGELASVVTSRTVNGRAVTVRRLIPGDSLDGVHELFVGGSTPARQQLLQRARGTPVLIVTKAEDALDQGSMINFRLVDGRVRFEVALDATDEAGLKVSSRMLGVALHVRKAQSH